VGAHHTARARLAPSVGSAWLDPGVAQLFWQRIYNDLALKTVVPVLPKLAEKQMELIRQYNFLLLYLPALDEERYPRALPSSIGDALCLGRSNGFCLSDDGLPSRRSLSPAMTTRRATALILLWLRWIVRSVFPRAIPISQIICSARLPRSQHSPKRAYDFQARKSGILSGTCFIGCACIIR